MAKVEFGERIAQFRRELAVERGEDIGQADVARAMGITRSAYAQWEKGITRPKDIAVFQKLAHYFGVDLSDLGVDIAAMAPEPRDALPVKKSGVKQITAKDLAKSRTKGRA